MAAAKSTLDWMFKLAVAVVFSLVTMIYSQLYARVQKLEEQPTAVALAAIQTKLEAMDKRLERIEAHVLDRPLMLGPAQ